MSPAATLPRRLPDTFRRHRFNYKLVERSGRVAIYEQRAGNHLVAYEVALIRVQKALPFPHGSSETRNPHQMRERYPSDEDWGCYGWTCSLYGSKVGSPVTR